MENALINILNIVNQELITPINNALNNTNVFSVVNHVIVNLINGVLRLWNNNNAPVIELQWFNQFLAQVIGIGAICFIIFVLYWIFKTIIITFKKAFFYRGIK